MRAKIFFAAFTLFAITAAMVLLPDTLQWDGQDYYRVETRLNQFTKSTQNHASVLPKQNGDWLATWQSRRQGGGGFSVYSRTLDGLGNPRGDETRVNEAASGMQAAPALALLEDRAVFAWESTRERGPGTSITLLDTRQQELTLSGQDSKLPASRPLLAELPDGRLLSVWQEGRGIMARADNRSFPITEEGWNPALSVLEDTSLAIAWSSSGETLLLARFSLQGELLDGPVKVADLGIEAQLISLDDTLLLAWMQTREQGHEVLAQRFDLHCNPLGEVFSASGGKQQSGVALARASDGSFVLAWNELSADGRSSDIHARRFSPEGGEVLRLNAYADGKQALDSGTAAARLACDEKGRLALTWSGNTPEDKSSANLTLLLPASGNPFARLTQGMRLGWQALERRIAPEKSVDQYALAMPHQPPSYQPVSETVMEPEPFFPGSEDRDAGFVGCAYTGWNPPDPHMAAGPDCLIGVVNGLIASFDRDGNLNWQEELEDNYGFWSELGADWCVFDPEVIFDPHSQRFMIMACERDNNQSYFDFAVSTDAYPDDASDWHKYRLNVTSISGNDIDSPNMAVDEEAIYLTADFFSPDKYLVYILDKSSVLEGGSPVSTHVMNTGSQSFGIPVQYDDAPNMYMIRSYEGNSSSNLTLYAIQDPLGSPSLITLTLNVPTYWRPINARSLGSSSTIETFEARFWSCVYRNGSLWACHHVCPTAARQKLVARWYEIPMNGWPVTDFDPYVAQQGDVLPNDTGYAYFNSIAANDFGMAAMTFTWSSTSDYFQIWRCYRMPDDPPGTMRDPVLVKASNSSLSGGRFGDYSGAAADPTDGISFWTFGEYAQGGNLWGTWFGTFTPDATSAGDFSSAGLRVEGIWPNPTPAGSRVEFHLPARSRVSLEIHDVRGRRVASIEGGELRQGRQGIEWNGFGEKGQRMAAGTYFAQLRVNGKKVPAGKILLVD